MHSPSRAPTAKARLGPWLFGARADLIVFSGSSLVALALAWLGARLGFTALPPYAWLVLVLAIDVAHVHASWFRSYFDPKELARRKLRYVCVPLVAYAVLALAYRASELGFWRVLAYTALFHFVRQQVGWVALYRARSGRTSELDRRIDEAAVYAATLFPLFVWHAHASSSALAWFVPGDFVELPLAPYVAFARALWALALSGFFLRQLWVFWRTRRCELGKSLVLGFTALTWYAGIVDNQNDFVFSVTNVLPHGIPYAWLVYAYARERARDVPAWSPGQLAVAGFFVFGCALVGMAFFEELAWDRFVDHERTWLFGAGPALTRSVLAWLVPLLALPQATHYLLDGLLWRRAEARELPALRRVFALESRPLAAETAGALALPASTRVAHGALALTPEEVSRGSG